MTEQVSKKVQRYRQNAIDKFYQHFVVGGNGRAVSEKGINCVYVKSLENGTGCAVGILLSPSARRKILTNNKNFKVVGAISEYLPKYINNDIEFYKDLQQYHDDVDNWTKKGKVRKASFVEFCSIFNLENPWK